MAFSRNSKSRTLTKRGKMFHSSSTAAKIIKSAVDTGRLTVSTFVLADGQRLDLVSANYYGDASYWWVIAAASGIGWQCQVPPGTLLKIPTSLNSVAALIGAV